MHDDDYDGGGYGPEVDGELLGDFASTTAETRPEDRNPVWGRKFALDGEVFTCWGYTNVIELGELARLATRGAAAADSAAAAGMAEILRQAMGEEEYTRLRQHMAEHETDPAVQVGIVQAINDAAQRAAEKLTGRPTPGRRPSSPTPAPRAERTSRIISLASGEVTLLDSDGQATPARAGANPAAGKDDAKAGPVKVKAKAARSGSARTGRGRAAGNPAPSPGRRTA